MGDFACSYKERFTVRILLIWTCMFIQIFLNSEMEADKSSKVADIMVAPNLALPKLKNKQKTSWISSMLSYTTRKITHNRIANLTESPSGFEGWKGEEDGKVCISGIQVQNLCTHCLLRIIHNRWLRGTLSYKQASKQIWQFCSWKSGYQVAVGSIVAR